MSDIHTDIEYWTNVRDRYLRNRTSETSVTIDKILYPIERRLWKLYTQRDS